MNATQQLAAIELAELRNCVEANHFDDKLFSMFSSCPRGNKPGVYRLLAKKGLIVRHPDNDRYDVTVWKMTDLGMKVRPGEEISAVL